MRVVLKHSLPCRDLPQTLAYKLQNLSDQDSLIKLKKLVKASAVKNEIFDILDNIDKQLITFDATVDNFIRM